MRYVLVSMALVLMACSKGPPPVDPSSKAAPAATVASTAPAAAPAAEKAPAPFTTDQLRSGCPVGRRIVYKIEEEGKPVTRRTLEFLKSDANTAEIRATTSDASGKELNAATNTATWAELRSHGEFDKDRVEVKHRTVSLPVGTLEASVYKVTELDGTVTTYYFADTLPGPPVFLYVEKDGKRIRTQTMESSTGPR